MRWLVTRENYRRLYSDLHRRRDWFEGKSTRRHCSTIKSLIEETESRHLLDYGCGKGLQYSDRAIHERWGGIMPALYDVGVPQFSKRPKKGRKFDGVLCVDVMEHIAEDDIDVVLRDIFKLARKFVFLVIHISPSRHKQFPDGRNVHLTVKPPEWWDAKIEPFRREGLIVKVMYR